ncbi:YiiX/YebB-like N1pC/P60 family cysteine hydrolase [Neisseriaceae bacterium JH1-16]|nr:YiiX/YebB-like N1pC/P60 family cysteine hydrolase [Neisseriaceae bacterium JH1-16]
MSHATLLFTTTRLPLSWLIRAGTWSTWSHVALIDGDSVIEAAAGHGVRRQGLAETLRRASHHAFVALPVTNGHAVVDAAASQLGKRYDYSALAGLGLHRDWQSDDAWFCSELVAWSFQQAGSPLFRPDCLRRVTPQHLWMLSPSSSQFRLA